jgi:acyl carrier protein
MQMTMENMISSQQNSEMADSQHSQEIAATVISVVSAEMGLPSEDLTLKRSFEELGIDSLNGLSIITELENAFTVHLENEAIAKIRTLADVVRAVENAFAEKAGEGGPHA